MIKIKSFDINPRVDNIPIKFKQEIKKEILNIKLKEVNLNIRPSWLEKLLFINNPILINKEDLKKAWKIKW